MHMFFLSVFKRGHMGLLAEIVHWLAMYMPQAVEHPLENLILISYTFCCMNGGHLNRYAHIVIDAPSNEMKYIFMVGLLHFENVTFLFFASVVSLVIFQAWHTRLNLCVYVFYILTYWILKNIEKICVLSYCWVAPGLGGQFQDVNPMGLMWPSYLQIVMWSALFHPFITY